MLMKMRSFFSGNHIKKTFAFGVILNYFLFLKMTENQKQILNISEKRIKSLQGIRNYEEEKPTFYEILSCKYKEGILKMILPMYWKAQKHIETSKKSLGTN